MSEVTWHVHDQLAQMADGDLALRLNLVRPQDGMHGIRWHGQGCLGLVPMQSWADTSRQEEDEVLVEQFVRDGDLIVKYAQRPTGTAYRQVIWRSISELEYGGVEWVASVQTSLLASQPALHCQTVSPTGSGWWSWNADDPQHWHEHVPGAKVSSLSADQAPVFLCRLADVPCSYVEMVFPADYQGAELFVGEDGGRLRYTLFQEFLEKGVIRRGRVRAIWVPRDGDLQYAEAAFRSFVASPIPLGT
ncbi:MAG: hypothetical protein R3E01_32610 [Pirellulaceae bacterium]|nr:hypothetical protein [Planctomycetales bacterium]